MKILIVAWAWPPIGRVGCLRPLGFAREWARAGHVVHVLTGPGDRGGEFAPDLLPAAEASGALVHRAPAPALPRPAALRAAFQEDANARVVRRPISRLRQVLGQWKGFPDLQRSWIRPAIRLGRELHAAERFDVAWSTSPPESVHFVGRALSRSVPCVADFRDQWSEYLLARWDPLSRWIIDRIAARVLARASGVTAATEGVRLSIERTTCRVVTLVRNGFDPVQPTRNPVRPRVLGYFGRIDPLMQHPERLWAPLRRLRAEGRPWSVEFYTTPGGGGGAPVDVPPDLVGLVHVLPTLPHAEALDRMQTMGALLVLAWETRGGETSVGGKVYEYIGAGRPVLVCAPPHHENRRLVEATRAGRGAWGDEETASALAALESGLDGGGDRGALARSTCALQAARVLEEAASRRPGDGRRR